MSERTGRRRGLRIALVVSTVVGVVLAGLGYATVSAASEGLSTSGPTKVSGTEATAVFRIEDRTIRQIRYADRTMLSYWFTLENNQALPLTVTGLSPRQRDERLFGYRRLVDEDGRTSISVPGNGSVKVRLDLMMSGCESLSARAGSFAHELVVSTERLGIAAGDAQLTLPEEIHTGSPREEFCPDATAESRPPG